MDTFKTIVEIIIAILVIRYIIQKYNVLGCYREPVRKTRADIDTYKDQEQANAPAAVRNRRTFQPAGTEHPYADYPGKYVPQRL